ncbi:unnamed protein product [Protopolystoma xenopodis]|uniref:Uncharacterized protein n=1 Tax=Protopolystoma xenopodis TaxID=117903 RepID=A0A448WK91_9PLAT|nr:unnamed protein product [Protopolystoma xenopodis]
MHKRIYSTSALSDESSVTCFCTPRCSTPTRKPHIHREADGRFVGRILRRRCGCGYQSGPKFSHLHSGWSQIGWFLGINAARVIGQIVFPRTHYFTHRHTGKLVPHSGLFADMQVHDPSVLTAETPLRAMQPLTCRNAPLHWTDRPTDRLTD